MSRLLALTRIMQIEVLDRVLGDLNALLPSEIDTVAIVNAAPDAGQAEEHLEIIEVTGGLAENERVLLVEPVRANGLQSR